MRERREYTISNTEYRRMTEEQLLKELSVAGLNIYKQIDRYQDFTTMDRKYVQEYKHEPIHMDGNSNRYVYADTIYQGDAK